MDLALSGWCDKEGNVYGGKNIVPDWIKLETGITGKVKKDVKNKLLKKWQSLKPKLSGLFFEIADSTISCLKK